jgi:hypothetical protein
MSEVSRIPRWLRLHVESTVGLGSLAAVAMWLLFWFSGD